MIKVPLTPQQRDWLVGKLTGLAYTHFQGEDKDVAIAIADKARDAPNLEDGCTTPPQRQPGAGYTTRDERGNAVGIPDANDDLYG